MGRERRQGAERFGNPLDLRSPGEEVIQLRRELGMLTQQGRAIDSEMYADKLKN